MWVLFFGLLAVHGSDVAQRTRTRQRFWRPINAVSERTCAANAEGACVAVQFTETAVWVLDFFEMGAGCHVGTDPLATP